MKFTIRLESIGTMIGFDTRTHDRPYFTSSGRIVDPTRGNEKGDDPIRGISWHQVGNQRLVTKPVEAALGVIVAQPGGNTLSALEMLLSDFGSNTPNLHKLKTQSAVIKEAVHIQPDFISQHHHLFLRDKSNDPVILPKNITDNSQEWKVIESHTSTHSAKGAIGRVIRKVAYYHAPWSFNLEVFIDDMAPEWLDADYIHQLFIIGGKYIGIGAGRTRAEGSIRGFGRFAATRINNETTGHAQPARTDTPVGVSGER